MNREFVERRDGSFYLAASRVPLARLVREFQHGELPEAIRSHYPTLILEEVYGAITFYLGSKEEVEADIAGNPPGAGRSKTRAGTRTATTACASTLTSDRVFGGRRPQSGDRCRVPTPR